MLGCPAKVAAAVLGPPMATQCQVTGGAKLWVGAHQLSMPPVALRSCEFHDVVEDTEAQRGHT